MDTRTPLATLTVPWGRQEIELQDLAFDGSGVRLLRVRIREGKRFTIFDIDAVTAQAWAEAMSTWARRQLGFGAEPDEARTAHESE